MMSRRTGLGRGLDALIPGGERPPASGVETILIDQISEHFKQLAALSLGVHPLKMGL